MSKRKTLTIMFAVWMAFTAGILVYNHARADQGYNYTCPAGQTPIGDGQCRQTPTGCAYGDSIPKDSEKCSAETATPKDQTPTAVTTPSTPAQPKASGSCTPTK